jgi:hypothetical protein
VNFNGTPAAPGSGQPEAATHVIAWLPPYLIRTRRWLGRPAACGWWDLQEIGAWEAGDPPPGDDWSLDPAPGGDSPARLAGWAAGLLGCPVSLRPAVVRVRPGRLPFRRWREEPAYWVAPVTGGQS